MSSSTWTITDNRKLFTGTAHAETYQRFRPTYPPAVFEAILAFLAGGHENSKASMPYQMTKQYHLAVDMGCGTGQGTPPLAEHFAKVIGCDVSKSQIEEASLHNKLDNVEFHVSPCEDMSLVTDESVDLVTCALAFHYVDPDLTYQEVKRILQPGGVLAIYAYGLPVLETKEAREAFDEYFYGTVMKYTSPQVDILLNHYRDLNLPFEDVTRKDDLSIERDVPLSSFIGYLESYSSYRTLLAANPDSSVLQEFSNKLKSILAPGSTASDDPTIHVSYPVFIVMGRKR